MGISWSNGRTRRRSPPHRAIAAGYGAEVSSEWGTEEAAWADAAAYRNEAWPNVLLVRAVDGDSDAETVVEEWYDSDGNRDSETGSTDAGDSDEGGGDPEDVDDDHHDGGEGEEAEQTADEDAD